LDFPLQFNLSLSFRHFALVDGEQIGSGFRR
jgi:hypothetical protein